MNSPRKGTEIDARELRVTFSPAVQEAFGDLAAAVRKSEHFDSGIHRIVQAWSSGEPTTVHDVMISLPLIAEEMATHVAKSADPGAREAWRSVCNQMSEHGFTLAKSPQRTR